jgi:aminoglycoside phosphotransferase (APT) family kinase protein
MDAADIVARMAPSATIKEISSGANRVFRLLEESGRSSVVKVFTTLARERRERHALEALAGIPGVPHILERGATEGKAWIRLEDGGAWSLATLPKNLDATRRAGAVLRGIHDSNAPITNLEGGIDAEYVQTHYLSTLDRLARYRRRLNLPSSVLADARIASTRLEASKPHPSHTRPHPGNFVVNESGEVTLVDWEWATLAPPEWDLSLATWRFSRELGQDAAEALWSGYGATFPQSRLRPWVAYHAAMMMLSAAEQRDGRLGDLAYLVDDLARSVS